MCALQFRIHCAQHNWDMNGYGSVWYHEDRIANCLSLALILDLFRITLDTSVDQAFYLHQVTELVSQLTWVAINLYASDITSDSNFLLITTVDGKKQNYSAANVQRTKAA